MKKILPKEYDGFLYLQSPGSSSLICLHHGYGGNSSRSYWGNIPSILVHDPKLNHCDVLLTEYNAKRGFAPNILSFFGFDKRLVSFADSAKHISSYIELEVNERGYQSVFHIGHSLGAHVSLHTAKILGERSPTLIQNIALINPPNKAIMRAKIWNLLTLYTNDHTRNLASNNFLRENLINLATEIRTTDKHPAINVEIIQGTRDAVVDFNDEIYLDNRTLVHAGHNWFSKVKNIHDPKYQVLRRAILGARKDGS